MDLNMCSFVICFLTLTATRISFAEKSIYNISHIGDCELSQKAYAPKTIKHFANVVTVKKKKILELNFTVLEKTLPVINTIRAFRMIQKKKQLHYTIANLTCTNPVARLVWKKLHLKYDRNCCLLPGVVTVNNLSLDDIVSKRDPASSGAWDTGVSMFDYQFHTRAGVLLCISIKIDIIT